MHTPLSDFLALLLVSLVTSSPVPESHRQLQTRIDYTDSSQLFDESCWTTLGTGDFLNKPNTGWNITHACSGTASDELGCCAANEPWSTCFFGWLLVRRDIIALR